MKTLSTITLVFSLALGASQASAKSAEAPAKSAEPAKAHRAKVASKAPATDAKKVAAAPKAAPPAPPAAKPARGAQVRTAAIQPKGNAMAVRHESQYQSARATLRGNRGLDPTAGVADTTVLLSAGSRSASMSNFLGGQLAKKVTIGPKKKKAKGKSVKDLPKFVPDALDFLEK